MSLLDEFLEASPTLAPLKTSLERAARSDAVVLIVGEAGTGRTSLARALHAASARAAGPLVEVNPGVIPATLFESEFFGFRPGAFTGADRTSLGRVELADGGTLVLDPIEELPVQTQPKLLRLVAERRMAPLAGAERQVDVRFIATASEELHQRVKRGTFREDLYYRLEVLAFRLPPLRERRADLEPLQGALLRDLGHRYGRPAIELSARAREWMARYSWPGNLRQLRNVLERALVLAPATDRLEPEPPADSRRPPSLQEVEREAILKALEFTRGHQGKAAEILGISRKALWEKRKRMGIP